MGTLVFDAIYNSEGVMRGIRESQRAFAELRSSAENEGIRIDNAFNRQIHEGSQAVNALTGKIIDQKKTVRSLTKDIDTLTESYKKVTPDSVKGKDLFASLEGAKSMLKNKKDELLELQTQQAQTRLSVRKLRDEYSLYQKEGRNVVDSNNNMALSFKKTLAAIGGTAMIQKFVSDVVRVRGQFQQLDVAFTTLLQSKDKSNALMQQMVQTAAKTPFNLTELATGAKQLVAYGFASEGVNETLVRLGNIASGLGLPLERLTYLYGTTMTQGRLYARDLMQFTTSGIPMLQGLADMYGVSTDKVNEMVTAGKIGFPEVQKVIENLTNEGGKFFNLMEEQSKTITGKISNLGDSWAEMLNKIGQSQEGVINNSIDGLKYLVENYETVGKILTGLVATYGTYKAATIAYYAITKTYGVYDIATKELQFAATMKNIVATKAMTVQQSLLNAAMLKNPYVLAAVALVSIASAMWALHDSTTESEKAQKRFNEKQEEAKKIEEEHKQRIDSLVESSRDIALSDLQRGQSLAELRREYPKIFAQYDIETIKLTDILKLKRQIAEEDTRRGEIKKEIELSDIEIQINYYEKLLKSLSGQQGVDGYVKKLKQLRLDRDVMLQDKGKGISEQFVSNLKNIDEKELKHYADVLQKKISGKGKDGAVKIKLPIDAKGTLSDEAVFDVKTIKALVDSVNSETKRKAEIQKADRRMGKDWLKDKKDTYDQAIKDLEAYENSKKELTKEEYEKGFKEKKEKVEIAKKSYEDAGGKTSSQENKAESAAEKLRKQQESLRSQQEKYSLLMDKQTRKRVRAEEDAANEIRQAKIDADKDGAEKVLKQRELNHDKEIQAIVREAEDRRQAVIDSGRAAFESAEDLAKAEDPKHVKKTFDEKKFVKSDDAIAEFLRINKVAQGKVDAENAKYNRGDDLANLINEYQDYTDKRLAIETKYNNDLATLDEQRKQAVKDGDTKQVEQIDRAKAQATKNKGMELMGMDYDKLKESPDYVRAFENLKETSSETLNSLLSQLENAKGAAAKVLSPDQLREYTTTIQEIMDELDERNPFQALSDKKEELAAAEEGLAQAQMELENARQQSEAVKGGAKIEVTTTKYNEKTKKIDSTKSYLTEAQALEKVKTKTNEYNAAKDNVVKKSAKVKKSEKEVAEQIDELAKAIRDVGNSIGGPAGEIISLIGDIGTFAITAMSGIKAVSDTTATAISTVEKASVILMIISAAIQIATKMLDLFGGDDTTEKYEKTKEAYESYINILDQVIDKQLEMAESLSGASAKAAYDKAIELVKNQSEAAKVLGKQYLNSGASWKTHSKGYEEVDDMSSAGWDDGAKALGMSVDDFKNKMGGRMDGLFDLTDEQLAKLQGEAHIFWAQLDDDTQDYANQIAEGISKVAEVAEQQMADVTLIDVDTLRSDFHDLLTDMDADTADFADNFEEYMKNAILNSMLKEQYMGRLTEWRKKFYAAMGDGVTEEEYNALKNEGQQISDEMKADRDGMADMFGWASGESSSEESSKRNFASMSQDTGNELNGRFTALQISNEEIKNSMLSMLSGVNLISTTTAANGITLMEIRNLAISSNSYLEDIAGFQKRIVNEFGSKLDNINSGIKQFNGKH